MAVLDLLTLKLIEPGLAIENLATSVGRVFHARLQSILGRRGLFQLCWGRHCDNPGLVGLILVWEDEATRDVFRYSEQDFWSFNKYLEVPMSLRMIRNVDPNQMIDLKDKCLLIRTLVRTGQDNESDATRHRCRQAFLADTDVESLQGTLYRVDEADEYQRDLKTLSTSKDELRYVESANTLVGVIAAEAYSQKTARLSSIAINEIIRLKNVTLDTPVAPHEVITATRLSHVFVRDPTLLTVPPPQMNLDEVDIGPVGRWRPPSIAYWIGDRRCFNYTGSLVNAKPRTPGSLSLGTCGDSYFETLPFVFRDNIQDPAIEATVLDSFRAYRKCLYSQPGSKNLYFITHPSKPRLYTLFVEWASSSDSATFHASQLAKDSLLKVEPYLASTKLPSPFAGVAFHPQQCNNVELIDFILAPSATVAEKRAFLLFLEDMLEIMLRSPESCMGAGVPMSVHAEGWVDITDPAHSVEINEASAETMSGPTYRIMVLWDGFPEEAEWVRQFVKDPRLFGIPPHMIAQCVDRVVAKQVRILREGYWCFKDENEESEDEEDLGF